MLSWFKKLFKRKVEKRFIDDYEYNSIRKENEDELNVDDVLDPDYENLSALQKALMDCLVPK